MTSTAKPTVYVVDDDAGVRQLLERLIQSVGLPVETFASAQDFLRSYDPSKPGCLVLDIRMPGMSGLELQELLSDEQNPIPIIMITGHGEVSTAVRAMRCGAVDFLEKPFSNQDVIDRINWAYKQVEQRCQDEARIESAVKRFSSLSPREREILDPLIEGKPVRIIAQDLGLSHKTVQAHRTRILSKTECKSLPSLIWLVDTVRRRHSSVDRVNLAK